MTGRLDRLRALIADQNLDGVIITSPANRFYLSGFLSDDDGGQSTAALLVDHERAVLLTGSTNLDWARGLARDVDVREWSRPWPPFVSDMIKDAGWHRAGFEDTAMTVAEFVALKTEIGEFPALIPLGSRVDKLRRDKDSTEIAHMKRVLRLTDEAFGAATARIIPGMTERDIAWCIDKALRDAGADSSAFPTIVASGPNASRPHHAPSEREPQSGEPIIIDMGARLDGYNGDLTRTLWLGDPSNRLRDVLEIVAAAKVAAWDAVYAGARTGEVHEVAKAVAVAAGYGDQYLHGTGHGLGIQVHEAPSCGAASDDTLQVGDVLTIEPGVYIPGWGGVRIEDVGVIEDGGFSRLTAAEQRLM